MQERNNRLDSLMEWTKSTYGFEMAQHVARESPQDETDFWIALNKARAARNLKYRSAFSAGRSALSR